MKGRNRLIAIVLSGLGLLIGGTTLPPIVFPPTPPGPVVPAPANALLDEVNLYRQRNGRPPYRHDACCETQAAAHARAVNAGTAKPHDGFSARASTCGLSSAGENWAQASTAAESVRMWNGSPGHRANMLGDWEYAGAAIVGESAVLFCGDRQGLFPAGQLKP